MQGDIFLESYREDLFESHGMNTRWVQDNQSYSTAGIVRGLHFQTGQHAQAKLVRVISGKVLDVCVDLRKGSPTFGKYHAVVLDESLQNMLYVPTGFGAWLCGLGRCRFLLQMLPASTIKKVKVESFGMINS